MRSNVFKLSAVAATVLTSLGANAALYQVVEIGESQNKTYAETADVQYYGTAVQQGNAATDPALGCFDSGATCDANTFKIAAETRNWPDEGISFREEVPFAMDNSFRYVDSGTDQYDFDSFENYCDEQLDYVNCDEWAERQFAGYQQELAKNYKNSIAFVEGAAPISTSYNAVINSLSESAVPVGNERVSDTIRNEAFSPTSPASPSGSPAVVSTHAFSSDGTYTVGSVSRQQATDDNGTWFYSKPTIWNGSTATELNLGSGGVERDNNYLGQGSIRDFIIDGSTFYGVGYNTYSDQDMNATVFTGDTSNLASTASVEVGNATGGSDRIYSNSVLASVNDNKVAVGSAKLKVRNAQNGSAANKLFYVSNIASPSATFFSGGVFFEGAGGSIGSINNFNEAVGSVDMNEKRETGGTARPQRGFINPLNLTGTNSDRLQIFQGRSWFLDDLTNGGSFSASNNEFRVINASDINDAGVISATALKCEGGYKTTEHDSKCQDGSPGIETIVAVKLIPIANEAERSIETRSFSVNNGNGSIERSGASLGWLALGLLTLLGFRRKQ